MVEESEEVSCIPHGSSRQYQKTDLVALLAETRRQVQAFDWDSWDGSLPMTTHGGDDEAGAPLPPHVLTIQAPMVRCSRPPFRQICRMYGTDINYTHMIMSDSFVARQEARAADFAVYEGEDRLVVQLAGTNSDNAGKAAALVAPYCDAIDINCGCPQKWALKEGIGAAMMQKPQLVHDIVRSVWRQANIPCVVKTRVFKNDTPRSVEFAQRAEAAGASWVTIHGRTPCDNPSAPIRYDAIDAIRDGIQVPLVVNGGIESLASVYETARRSRVGGVMSGRGLLANPALFAQDLPLPTLQHPVHPEVLSDFMRLSLAYNANLPTTRHHLMLMMHQILSPSERLYFHNQTSLVGVMRCLKESGYWSEAGRVPLPSVPPEVVPPQ